jgi:uncharacterized membrane protein YkvA (DUF1232 family)
MRRNCQNVQVYQLRSDPQARRGSTPAVRFASSGSLDRIVPLSADITEDGDVVRTKNSTLWLAPKMTRSESAFAANWRRRAQQLQKEAHVFYFVVKHRRSRWYARMVAACAAGYVLSPIQLIPNFIPVIGTLDDFVVLFVAVKLLQKLTPADVLAECRQLADAAETRRKENIGWRASVLAPIVVAAVWVLAAITATALMAAYIYH